MLRVIRPCAVCRCGKEASAMCKEERVICTWLYVKLAPLWLAGLRGDEGAWCDLKSGRALKYSAAAHWKHTRCICHGWALRGVIKPRKVRSTTGNIILKNVALHE